MKRPVFYIFFMLLPAILLQAQDARFVIESIDLQGNSKTSDSVIFENLPYAVGDTVSEQRVHDGVARLEATGFFSEVQLQPHPGTSPGNLALTLIITERYWPSINFKGGFSELDGWKITPISFNFDNIFGLGNYTSFNFSFGDRVSEISFDYLNPNIFDSDFDLLFDFRATNREFVHYINQQKLLQNVPDGAMFIGLRPRNGLFRNVLFGFDTHVAQPDSFATIAGSDKTVQQFPSRIADFVHDRVNTTAFVIRYARDRRDQADFPTMGYWYGVRFDQADTQLNSDVSYTRFIADLRGYYPLYEKVVAAARIKWGMISSSAPFYEKFYLGGPNTLRGYADRSLSPVGGGENLLQGGLEIRFPLAGKNFPKHLLSAVLFIDTGLNQLAQESFTTDALKTGYGFGLRLRLPFIGLVRMDLAYPADGGERRIHFSLGHTF